jgi:hypothetical protein
VVVVSSSFEQLTGGSVDPYAGYDIDDDLAPVELGAPKKRSYSRVVVGFGAVALAGLLGAYAFVAASPEATQVMVAANELRVGEPIVASDLRVADVGSVSQLDAVTAEDQAVLIGLTPRYPFPAGTVLNPSLFVQVDEAIPEGKVIVGAVLAPGSAPTELLRVGDPVNLIGVTAGVGTGEAGPVVLGAGEIWAVGPASERNGASSDDVLVSMLVDVGIQADVAQAASDDRLWLTAVRAGS